MGKITLVIHGGSGSFSPADLNEQEQKDYKDKMQEALDKGYAILSSGGTSIDAVEAAINILEDSPLFNAGKGAVLTHDGKAELDASIMDGATLKAGAIASVTTIRNPVSAARKVMEKSPHVFLTGRGAELFAQEQGLAIVDNSYFITEKSIEQLKRVIEKAQVKNKKHGTVGAVALDVHGNLAAGTSTGGMVNKQFGRVGDSPIIGAGTYANNNTCAVSCTGHGEYFIRYTVAHDVSALMEYKGFSVDKAADLVINEKLKAAGGSGGLIALDREGNIAMPLNSSSMFRCYKNERGSATLIFK